jgi:autotransporter adhesin
MASGTGSTAVGDHSSAGGLLSAAYGSESKASGDASAAYGNSSTASGASSAAYGDHSLASSDNSAAFGDHSTAGGSNSVAIGSGANAGFTNSAAFGSGATATRANQQAFGTASNTYTMAGITSAASKAAQTGPTQLVTSDSGGNLATTTLADLGLASTADIGAINSRLDDLTTRSNRAYNGIAMAMAMAGVPTLLPGEKLAMTMNYGTFEGTSGVALNAAFRLSDALQITGGIGYGVNEQIAGGRVGLRMAW